METQDAERARYAQEIRKRPAEYSALMNRRVDEMSNEVFNRKRTAFQKAQIDLGRYMDMDHNNNFYKMRNADVDRLTNAMGANNSEVKNRLMHDKDMTKRQFEINEWYNYNKLETLFFLQVFFIAMLTMVVIIYCQKNSIITTNLAALLTFLVGFIVVALGVYRYYYTRRTRDNRLWHRRYFGPATAPKPAAKCDKDGNLAFDVNDLIPASVTQCADDAAGRFNSWQENLESEITAFQTAGTTPSRISGSGQSLGGTVCDNLNQG